MSVDRGCIEIQTSELSLMEDVRIHTCWIAGDLALPGQPGFHLREDRGWAQGLRLQGSILLLHSDLGAERPRLLVLSSPDYRAALPAPQMDTFLLLLETGTEKCLQGTFLSCPGALCPLAPYLVQ